MEIAARCSSCQTRNQFAEQLAGTAQPCEKCGAEIEVPFPPLELPEERTQGGSVVFRHEPSSRGLEPTLGDEQHIERISNHIEQHLGPIATVMHEVVSDRVHIDVHCVAPTDDRPFYTLVTSGMSERPMTVPPEAEEFRFAELMLCLPPDWPVVQDEHTDEANYWPIQWLKLLARFPHQYETWLFHGHTVPNGDPPEPFATDNDFTGWIILPSQLTPDAFHELHVDETTTIQMLAIYPLFRSEMDLKLSVGTDALEERFARFGVTELIDVDRANVADDL